MRAMSALRWLAATSTLFAVTSHAHQAPFSTQRDSNIAQWDPNWDTPPDPDGTKNLIFNSVGSAMRRWPNTLLRNGHSFFGASIPAGTMLYHGRPDAGKPPNPEWLAFDIDHSYIFCQGSCYMYTYVTTRPLRLAYLDGLSGGNTKNGTLDTQDLIVWGRARPEKYWEDYERIAGMCEWGKPLGLDGFVRMEFNFEVMMCDFENGLERVSALTPLPMSSVRDFNAVEWPSNADDSTGPANDIYGVSSSNVERTAPHHAHMLKGKIPREPPPAPAPKGWRGSMPHPMGAYFEAFHAGTWHDRGAGETRVHVDYSRFVTFYDESLTSLVKARRGVPKFYQRPADISKTDLARVMGELREVLGRNASVQGSGVDWGSVTRVIIQRYGARLEVLKHIMETDEFRNVTEHASQVRRQLLIGLSPYITADGIPAPGTSPSANTTWAASIMHYCSTPQTSRIPEDLFNKQERRIKDAVDGTLHEICRVLVKMWVRAFTIEEAGEDEMRNAMLTWKTQLKDLMAWLDWAVWIRCEPACGPDTMCYIPTFPFEQDDDPDDMTPRCIRRYAPYTW